MGIYGASKQSSLELNTADNPKSSKPILNQKGNIPITAAMVIVLVIIAGTGIYLATKQNQNTNTSTTKVNASKPTSNPTITPSSTNWSTVEAKFSAFMQEHLEKMRMIDSNTPAAKLPNYKFDRESIEITDNLITKYLPNYRIFTDKYFTFVLRSDGHIVVLGTTLPGNTPYKTAPDLEVLDYSAFIKNLKLGVPDSQTAIDMVKFKRIVDGGHGLVKDSEWESWKLEASKKNSMWVINMRYIGDPSASIFAPPSWKITVDQNNFITEIQELPPNR